RRRQPDRPQLRHEPALRVPDARVVDVVATVERARSGLRVVVVDPQHRIQMRLLEALQSLRLLLTALTPGGPDVDRDGPAAPAFEADALAGQRVAAGDAADRPASECRGCAEDQRHGGEWDGDRKAHGAPKCTQLPTETSVSVLRILLPFASPMSIVAV